MPFGIPNREKLRHISYEDREVRAQNSWYAAVTLVAAEAVLEIVGVGGHGTTARHLAETGASFSVPIGYFFARWARYSDRDTPPIGIDALLNAHPPGELVHQQPIPTGNVHVQGTWTQKSKPASLTVVPQPAQLPESIPELSADQAVA